MPRGTFINDVDEAQSLAAALIENQGDRTRDAALVGAASAVGVSKWSLWTLYYGRRKTVESGTLRALRNAYLKVCERQALHLVAEVDRLKRRCGDASVSSLGDEVARLVEKLRQARERTK